MLLMQLYRDFFGRSYTEIETEVHLGYHIGHHFLWNNIPTVRKALASWVENRIQPGTAAERDAVARNVRRP
jgi:hypothetical protein